MRVVGGKWTKVVGAAALAFVASAVAMASQDTPPAATGTSVLAGVYTDEQAKRGEDVSNNLCTSCHGPDLSGGEAGPALVGLEFLGNWTNLTVADLFDRIHSTMPADAPGTMTPQQVSDVTAYVLKLNKFPAGATELASELAPLKNVTIEGPR